MIENEMTVSVPLEVVKARVDKALAISVALEKNENKCVKQV